MRIDLVEIRNFRRLQAIRIDFYNTTTLLVGANNSGKTSAITALRYFLKEQKDFSVYDIPLAHWTNINRLGEAFETAGNAPPPYKWEDLLPSLDVWLTVSEVEIHHIAHLIPTLDWKPTEGIGLRLQLQPVKPDELLKAYLKARKAAWSTLNSTLEDNADVSPKEQLHQVKNEKQNGRKFSLWPRDLMDFLKNHISDYLSVNAYLLDPAKKTPPISGVAQPQELPHDAEPVEGNPLKGLIKIHEVPAHRDLSDYSGMRRDSDEPGQAAKGQKQPLTTQLPNVLWQTS